MLFVKVINGQPDGFPKTVKRIVKEHPHISFPNIITVRTMLDLGYEPVPPSPEDFTNFPANSRVVLLPPIKKDGIWKRQYHVRPYTQLEIDTRKTNLRKKRDVLLKECDWTELPSVRAQHTTEWATAWDNYRQALRDITNADDVFRVSFPDKPTINE